MGYLSKVFKRIILLLLSILLLFLVVKLSIFYMPFLIAFIIASLIEPIIRFVKKHTKLQRKTSAIIVLITVSTIIIGIIAWGITVLISESSELLQSLNIYTDKIYESIFKEKSREYREILKLKSKDRVRDTFYSEILDLIA